MKNLYWDCGQTHLNDFWLLMPYNIKEYFIEHVEPDFIKEADKNAAIDKINFRKEMEILTRDDLSHKNEDRDYYGFILNNIKRDTEIQTEIFQSHSLWTTLTNTV